MLPHTISHEAWSSAPSTVCSTRATSALESVGPVSLRFTVSPCLSVTVRLVRMGLRMGNTAVLSPPKEWITQEALMPRPPPDSRLELTYARSSKARRSTLIVRSMAGLMVSVTIKLLFYAMAPAGRRFRLLQPPPPPWETGGMAEPGVNLWTSAAHALEYLGRADKLPHRTEGEAMLLQCLPRPLGRVLDLGSGDGRLLALVMLARPEACAVALDFSPAMLDRLRARFTAAPPVEVLAHDLDRPLPAMGVFQAVVSSFAIHHLRHDRKRELYREIHALLGPRGVFLNLEHVTSPTEALHLQFLDAIAWPRERDDPSNKLLDVGTQLAWLREIGFADVDCLWKWRELALLAGVKPA